MFSKRPWWSLTITMVAVLLLASCGGAAQPAPAPTEAAAPAPAATEAAAPTEAPATEAPATEAAVAEPTEAATEAAATEPAAGGGGKVVRISYTQEPSS